MDEIARSQRCRERDRRQRTHLQNTGRAAFRTRIRTLSALSLRQSDIPNIQIERELIIVFGDL